MSVRDKGLLEAALKDRDKLEEQLRAMKLRVIIGRFAVLLVLLGWGISLWNLQAAGKTIRRLIVASGCIQLEQYQGAGLSRAGLR